MFSRAIGALALLSTGVWGYENSSPLFLYSTAKLDIPHIQDLSSASSIQPILDDVLSQCPTTNYLLVSQPGVTSDDYVCPKNTPFLSQRIGSPGEERTSLMVRDVIGNINVNHITNFLSRTCNKGVERLPFDSIPELSRSKLQSAVFTLELPSIDSSLSTEGKKAILEQHDNFISSLVENYFTSNDYTLIYLTQSMYSAKTAESSSEAHEYNAEIPFMHSGELVRRNLAGRKNGSANGNQTIVDGPLFDKYQFFTPGIFMGLFVGLILLAILYVGISALSSLQVTYGAFDKEQGQLAAKKQQ